MDPYSVVRSGTPSPRVHSCLPRQKRPSSPTEEPPRIPPCPAGPVEYRRECSGLLSSLRPPPLPGPLRRRRKPSRGRTIKQLRRRQPCECFSSWTSSESFLPSSHGPAFPARPLYRRPILTRPPSWELSSTAQNRQNWVTLGSRSAIAKRGSKYDQTSAP